MAYKYSTKAEENNAKAVGVGLPISTKQSVMICQYVRGKKLQMAKQMLSETIGLKKPVPFTRFTNGLGHKPGKMAAGRFPIKACQHILEIIETAEANAQFKGLSTPDLVVKHISAQKAANTWRYGRQSRIKAKRTHVEVVLEEKKAKKEAKQ